MKNKEIIIITTGWFPEGDAGAIRLSMMGRILVEAGYKVTILCRGALDAKGIENGVNYLSLRNMHGGVICKAIDYELFPFKAKRIIDSRKHSIYAIYLYNAHIRLFKYVKSFCRRYNIKLIHDCVEWYSPEEFTNGEKSNAYKIKNIINTKIIDDQFNIIAISSYLTKYYESKGIHTIKIPIRCDASKRETAKPLHDNDKLVIFYGGSPGAKDLIGNILNAVLLLKREERERLKIILVGASEESLVHDSHISRDVISQCGPILEICGRVARSEVLSKMEEADFAFLARDASLRYAQAGFPSKVVEALCNATPMLCNISSDLGEYLVDGKNAIISKSHNPDDLSDAIRRALKLTAEEKNRMSIEALNTAKERFDYRSYLTIVSNFLSGKE